MSDSSGGILNMSAPRNTPPSDQLAQVSQLLEHFEQLETQLEQVRDGLTHSHRLATLGTIASIIAHEYNNILTPIINYGQLALAKPDDQKMLKLAVEKAVAGRSVRPRSARRCWGSPARQTTNTPARCVRRSMKPSPAWDATRRKTGSTWPWTCPTCRWPYRR